MRHDPHLKLLEVAGWYDMATPFFGAEYDINHMALEPDRKANVSFKYYPSGHMVYIEPGSAHQLKTDLDAFIDSAK
jgi:carboxypeptidase C (cathepsin A)